MWSDDAQLAERDEWRFLCAAGYVHYTNIHPTDSTQDEWEVTPQGQAYFKAIFEDYAREHPECLEPVVPTLPTRTLSSDEIDRIEELLDREIAKEQRIINQRNRARKIYNGILTLCIIALLTVIL